MTLELVLIRHGATAGNQERRYVGQMDDQPLTDRGRQALLALRAQKRYPHCEALYASPLSRCRETARILYPMLVPVLLPSLTELDFGAFEGKTYEQLKEDPAYRRWIDTAGRTAPPGGEGGDEFVARLRRALEQIVADAERSGFRRAAVVTHGGCIMTMLGGVRTAGETTDFYQYQAPNGGGFRAELDSRTLQFAAIRPL